MSSSRVGSDGGGKLRPRLVLLEDPSQIGEARRAAVALADDLGFSEAERSDIAIVVTEAATNVVRHAGSGRMVLQPAPTPGPSGLELLCLDRGPGMANVAECLRDGYSTAGTPGNGLGAIARLAHKFEAFSRPASGGNGGGTALLCRFWARDTRPAEDLPAQTGAVCLPLVGEVECGDAWAAAEVAGRTVLLVVDGLGHGDGAAAAAREAVRLFRAETTSGVADPREILHRLHAGLRATRGAAATVVEIVPAERVLRTAGVGNVAGSVHAPGQRPRSLVSHNGIVGHQARKIEALTYPWPEGALLILHSDGLQTRWRLEDYPGLQLRDPGLIAGVLYRDYSRGRDDVTVLAHRDAPVAA